MPERARFPFLLAVLGLFALALPCPAGTAPLTFRDLMQFRQVEDVTIARDGTWVAYRAFPDRGDGEVVVRVVDGDTEHRIPRGDDPAISADARWVAARMVPTQQDRDEAEGKDDDEQPKPGLALLATGDGGMTTFERVQSHAFTDDGRWLIYHRHEEPDDGEDAEDAAGGPSGEEEDDGEDDGEEPVGSTLVVRRLATGAEIELADVMAYAVARNGALVAYARAVPGGQGNGLYVRDLGIDGAPEQAVLEAARGRYTHLAWARDVDRLGFVAAVDGDGHEPGPGEVWMWDGTGEDTARLAAADDAPDGWMIPSKNDLLWSRDGARLFFGFRPLEEEVEDHDGQEEEDPYDPYDIDGLVAKRDLDVWHWNDPRIVTNQKKHHEEHEDDTYRAVVHVEGRVVVTLGDADLPEVHVDDNPVTAVGISDIPYLVGSTWRGREFDVWTIDLRTGMRRAVVSRIRETPSSSPGGRFVAYWSRGAWFLFDAESGTSRDLTSALDTPFADEDWDYPSEPWSYGVAGWVEDDTAVLIHDKFDVWQFPTDGAAPFRITGGAGRKASRQFRVVDLDPENPYFGKAERVWMTAYHDAEKHRGLYRARVGKKSAAEAVAEGERWYGAPVKAEDADVFVFTRERYEEFPDLWVAGPDLAKGTRLSDVNPQIDRYAWGAAELVEWTGDDGAPLQGILIKPGGYEPGKRYPVLVYFYRLFTDRLFRFNQPVVNHRPSFPVYASHGYAVFLPDIRFEIGRPGLSATKALVSGIDHLVESGVADPAAIGLHGHSWSGYQTAFVVTRTDRFAAAVAGAPVSNMTSAYSGIRGKSGLARQFQYEIGQSRIGASLDERLHDYIDNSPVFFARHVKTPLLIQFGDRDEAVPWEQGIELYLALRRLGKPCVFLQYRDEPHHLKKYPNKLDYSRKMKAFFDHFLQGAPAPSWWTDGVPYTGD